MTLTLELSPNVSSVLEKEATLQNRSVEAVAADALEALVNEGEMTSELDDYEASPEDIEELRRRVQAVQEGDVMPFADYVAQVKQRRKAA